MYTIIDIRTGNTVLTVDSHAIAWIIVARYAWLAVVY